MNIRSFSWLALLICFGVSCVTKPVRLFDEVKVGMDRTDVIDKVGSPLRSSKRDDRQIWLYKFYEPQKIVYKEIQFKDELVVYAGDPSPDPDPATKPRVWPPIEEQQRKPDAAAKPTPAPQAPNSSDFKPLE